MKLVLKSNFESLPSFEPSLLNMSKRTLCSRYEEGSRCFITIQVLSMPTQWDHFQPVVVEWLACLPVTQKIGVRFYLERESSATSGWINVGCEWCCRGWSVEDGTPGGLLRTRDGLPRIRKARAAHNVHECESVCAWNKKNIVSAPKWLPCMNACMCAVFHCICICMCSN